MKKEGTFRRVEFTITRSGYGQYMLEAHYRGKDIKVHVTDSSLWDDIDEDSLIKAVFLNRFYMKDAIYI